jgi:hypothetical protein
MGLKQELSHGTRYNAELVMAPGHEPWGSEGPTLLTLPVGTLHSPAKDIAEVSNPVPIHHAAAPFSMPVPVDPSALAEGTTTGFVHRFEKVIPRLLVFLASFV